VQDLCHVVAFPLGGRAASTRRSAKARDMFPRQAPSEICPCGYHFGTNFVSIGSFDTVMRKQGLHLSFDQGIDFLIARRGQRRVFRHGFRQNSRIGLVARLARRHPFLPPSPRPYENSQAHLIIHKRCIPNIAAIHITVMFWNMNGLL